MQSGRQRDSAEVESEKLKVESEIKMQNENTKSKNKIFSLITSSLFLLFTLAGTAQAQGVGGVTAATDDAQQLVDLVARWYNGLLLPLGTILAGIMIAFGGITYAASGGDPTKAQKGKEYIFGAIIGLVLLILAALIVRTIIG